MEFTLTEIIGYVASFMVLISFTMKDIFKLRIINAIGAFLFIFYGMALDSIPIIITNISIVGVHIYYLIKPKKSD